MEKNEDPPPDRIDPAGLEEGDYYFTEEGWLVFTRQYHLKRGHCCGNKCRHCPYGHEAVVEERS